MPDISEEGLFVVDGDDVTHVHTSSASDDDIAALVDYIGEWGVGTVTEAFGAQGMLDAKTDLEGELGQAIMEHGGARVAVVVEPVEMPDHGDKVRTPEGSGEVVHPVTEAEVLVELDAGGRERFHHEEVSAK